MLMAKASRADGAGAECSVLPADYEPVGSFYWTNRNYLWVGALSCAGRIKFGLMKQSSGTSAEIVAEVGGPQSCRTQDGLVLMAGTSGETIAVDLGDENVRLKSVRADGKALQDCSFALAGERQKLEASGIQGVTGISFACLRSVDAAASLRPQSVLACRPGQGGETEFILADEESGIQIKSLGWPLARDNPVILPNSVEGGWIAYPSFTFDRRTALRNEIAGIPVFQISKNFEILLNWVPWSDWNVSGPYRFYMASTGLIAAIALGWTDEGMRLSGIYAKKDENWYLQFPGEVDIMSVAVAPQEKSIGWRQQVLVEPPSEKYGRLRYVPRVERL